MMRVTWPKIAAAAVALLYVGAAAADLAQSDVDPRELACLLVLLVPLALIWFPEVIGNATGFIGHGTVDCETPPWLVSAAGWLFLVGLPLLMWLVE